MTKFSVSGMSCAACSAAVERAVKKVSGVTFCAVNLLTNTMQTEGGSTEEIIAAVSRAGYAAKLYEAPKETDTGKETKQLKKRLAVSLVLLLPLLYFSMGHIFGIHHDFYISGIVQLLLTLAIAFVNRKFFISGFSSLARLSPNMDSLVAIGATASFAYSCTVLLNGSGMLYFESAAMILTLITVGKTLEASAKGHTTDALRGLAKLAPDLATVVKNGKEQKIPASELKTDDEFIVRAGEKFAADGIIIEGNAAIDESALTGESIPADKSAGDKVYTATINLSGFVRVSATTVGEETTLSKIIRLVADAASQKAPVAKAADKVSAIFVPVVLGIAFITTFVWLLLGAEFSYALARGISVLVISCPCALGLATPVAIMVGSGIGAKNGILFKTATALEQTGKIKCAALDKTGTLTTGKMRLSDVISYSDELETVAYSLETASNHPIAKAISETLIQKTPMLQAISFDKIEELPGKGIIASKENTLYLAGNSAYISEYSKIQPDTAREITRLENEGQTVVIFAKTPCRTSNLAPHQQLTASAFMRGELTANSEGACDRRAIIGLLSVSDTLKPDAISAIEELKQLSVRPVMLSGDNKRAAKHFANSAGIEEYYAELLPADKEKIIRSLCSKQLTAMVGDGINDAPSLKAADIGIAIGKGTDVAIDSADVVLMRDTLTSLTSAVKLSRAVLKNIHENLFWAFFYNALGIPLAAGVFAKYGVEITPPLCAAAMSLSSFCVVTNALRLNFAKIGSTENTDKNSANTDYNIHVAHGTEVSSMTQTIRIEGIMCPHCEARIKQALMQTDGITNAVVSHETGTAVVELSKEIAPETFEQLINNLGYKFVSVSDK